MIFESCPNETQYGPNLVGLLDRLQDTGKWAPKKKTVAIATSTDPYSVLIAENFRDGIKKEGWDVVVYEKVTAPLSEWGPVLSKIRSASPDLVVNTDWLATDLAAFTKQFMASPTPSLRLRAVRSFHAGVPRVGRRGRQRRLWSTNIGVLPDQKGEDFRARFDETFGVKMGFSTAGAIYDQVMIWAQAAGMAGDADDLPKVVERIKQTIRRGIVGTCAVRPRRQPGASRTRPTCNDPSLGMPLLSFQIQNGQQVCIDPFPVPHGRVRAAAAAQVGRA